MKRAINQLIEKELKGVDIYSHDGSMWFIFTEERRWVFEYTKENILWYNYSLFHSVFNFVSLDVTENTKYITDWFTKNILGKPILTSGSKFVWDEVVVNIIENSVKRTLPKSIADSFAINDTIQNGVKNTTGAEFVTNVVVEDTIQNGVKHTEDGDWADGDKRLLEIIQNGVKKIYDDCSDNQARVDGIIKIGKKL